MTNMCTSHAPTNALTGFSGSGHYTHARKNRLISCLHTACVFTVLTALGGATKRLDRQGLIGPVNGTIVELIAEVNTDQQLSHWVGRLVRLLRQVHI